MAHPGRVVHGGRAYRWGYQGQELEDVGEYGERTPYHFEYRVYSPSLGRWLGVDPLTDHPKQVDESPYSLSWNNPILLTDPKGDCPECEENVKDPKEGAIYTTKGGWKFTYERGEWVGEGMALKEVVVTPSGAQLGEGQGGRRSYYMIVKNYYHNVDAFRYAMEQAGTYEEQKEIFMSVYYYGMGESGKVFLAGTFILTTGLIGATTMGPLIPLTLRYSPLLLSTEFWAGKAAISGFSQGLVNKGKINLIGVASDAFLVPGASDVLGSAIDFKLNIIKWNTEFKMVGYNKSFKKFMQQSAISFGFSTKMRMLDSKYFRLNDVERYMIYTPNQLSNYGMQKVTEEEK